MKYLAPVLAAVLLCASCRTVHFTARGNYQLPASYEESEAWRTGKSDPFVNEIIESPEFSGYRGRDPLEYINLVAYHIKSNTKNEFERVKRAHDFVVNYLTYDVKLHRASNRSFFPKAIKKQDAAAVVRSGRAVSFGYANLFQAICNAMGNNSEVVNGYARGENFSPFKKNEYKQRPGHVWNIVQIYDCWYLIDVTWNAGSVEKAGKKDIFIKNYSTEWLFTNPQYFVYTHLPNNLNHELLEYLIQPEDFLQLPYQRPLYFETVIQMSPRLIKEYEVNSGVLSMSYILADNMDLEFMVVDKTGKKDLSKTQKYFEKKQTKRNAAQLYFNKRGKYILRIYTRESLFAGNEHIAECGLIVE
ncbi:MAG: hypothetical protein LBG74_03870 [Spirochaetaceae bacterium]|nr:hypothetical protein [Spirochaetaceae bacterium]